MGGRHIPPRVVREVTTKTEMEKQATIDARNKRRREAHAVMKAAAEAAVNTTNEVEEDVPVPPPSPPTEFPAAVTGGSWYK